MAINNYSKNWFDDYVNDPTWISQHGQTTIVANPLAPAATYGTAVTASQIMANRLSPSMMAQMNMEEMQYALKGEMVTSGVQLSEMQRETMVHTMTESGFKEHIKQQLCELLVKDMMKNNLIEYTMTTDPAYLTNTYRARAYVMPDSMVKILREYITRNT